MSIGRPNPYGNQGATSVRPVRRRRRALPLLPLAVAAWALLEIYLLILLGDMTSGFVVFLVLLGGLLLGGVVIKRAGSRAWQRLAASLRPEGAPADDRGGNGLTMLGGLLLMVPGLLSDLVGLLCLFPPTAALLRKGGARYLRRRGGPLGEAYREARVARDRMRMRRPDGRVVSGEVVSEEDEGREDDRDRGDRASGERDRGND
ncbi:FxsA family membrane protein [Streptomyces hainanensis]|uniref:FxsA family protein n=1 Tax=Streptomyces hainanensis TaxID=402648 RepID=A0A4R4TIJ5_9ACTN|nr:FxsA family membrane protein [Streptomyces hainanensis]TDC74823.1 FxsA family protein [Streptomyces hainanensis]